MRLTRAASYALHALVHIAANKPTGPLASHEIARAHKIPERFLLKVLKPLVSAGLLHSVKGPHGGYRLAKAPKEISMLQVIEAVDGPIRGLTAFRSDSSSNGLDRKLNHICVQAADQTRKHLGGIRLSALAGV